MINQSHRRRRGFTLIELLIAIGIILLLAGLLLPMALRAMKSGERTKAVADLQAISIALEAYKTDHGDYPRVIGDITNSDILDGAQTLVRALIAPGPAVNTGSPTESVADGADSFGFRVRGTQGKVYGPYLKVDQFKLRDLGDLTNSEPDLNDVNVVMVDVNNKPIMYFPRRPGKLNLTVANSYINVSGPLESSQYDITDNFVAITDTNRSPEIPEQFLRDGETDATLAEQRFHAMLGDYNVDGKIDTGGAASETAVDQPYLLWAAGPDGFFGPETVSATDAKVNKDEAQDCDDVTNFNIAP
jgi:prepilin-type N-terminal cleavage/methylation domain-containing protein